MAVTSGVGLGRGRPSSWSAAIDKLCYGGGDQRRLMVLSAGNIRDPIMAGEYLDANDLAEAENPCQAWNALFNRRNFGMLHDSMYCRAFYLRKIPVS
jgi:hypothetical protein